MKTVCIVCCFFSIGVLTAQPYLAKVDLSDIAAWQVIYYNRKLSATELGGSFLTFDAPQGVYLIEVDNDAQVSLAQSFSLLLQDSSDSWGTTFTQHSLNGNNRAVGFSFSGQFFDISRGNAVAFFDFEQNNYWVKRVSNSLLRGQMLSFYSDTLLLINYNLDMQVDDEFSKDSLGIASLTISSGNKVWGHYYKTSEANAGTKYAVSSAEHSSNSRFHILGGLNSFFDPLSLTPYHSKFFLLNIDEDGNVLKSVGVDSFPFVASDLVLNQSGKLFLSGEVNDDTLNSYYEDGFIVKMTEDYQLVWAKRLHAASYPCKYLRIKPSPSGGVIFTYVSTGDFPVILGEISSEGNLLWYKGYSFYLPMLDVDDFGAMHIMSSREYHQDGTSSPAIVLAKTNPDGEFSSCPQFDACLELVDDLSISFQEWTWMKSEDYGEVFEDLDFSLDSLEGSTSPYCGYATTVEAAFTFPDTVCLFSCVEPSDLQNENAQNRHWQITGPNLDTTMTEATFTWCFQEPGLYWIEQEVWVLGCSKYHKEKVVVLPELKLSLGENSLICQQPPYSLSANASRPLTSYLWSDSSSTAELQITSSGTYWLEASDGYCILRDTVQLTFLDDLLDQGPALSLPADTAVCEQHLPYELLPQSPYAEDFSVSVISNSSASSFELWQAGSYEVQAEVFGCPIRDSFALEVNDCRSRIYFPTAFSPNGDGLNDLFLPQGKDYEGIELQVYDRWGGLLFSSQAPPFAWDGSDAAGGVYVYRFRYWNTLALQEEEVSGQVVLLR